MYTTWQSTLVRLECEHALTASRTRSLVLQVGTPKNETPGKEKKPKKEVKPKEEAKPKSEPKNEDAAPSQGATKRPRKVYDMPGQTRDMPPENDPLRKFYESLFKEKGSKSEMARKYCAVHGLLPLDEAKKYVAEKGGSQASQRSTQPSQSPAKRKKAPVKKMSSKKPAKKTKTPSRVRNDRIQADDEESDVMDESSTEEEWYSSDDGDFSP